MHFLPIPTCLLIRKLIPRFAKIDEAEALWSTGYNHWTTCISQAHRINESVVIDVASVPRHQETIETKNYFGENTIFAIRWPRRNVFYLFAIYHSRMKPSTRRSYRERFTTVATALSSHRIRSTRHRRINVLSSIFIHVTGRKSK